MTIKEICQKYNLGQTALSRRFGIPLRTVQQWYAGDRNPPPYVVDMITEILQEGATMKFKDKDHEQRYYELLAKMKRDDPYHKSAAYLMALAELVPGDVFDFQEDCIRHEGVDAGWQTSSSRKATRLMFNLWNGWACEEDDLEDPKPSAHYAVDNIFSNYEYAPYFYEAVRIRFEWV